MAATDVIACVRTFLILTSVVTSSSSRSVLKEVVEYYIAEEEQAPKLVGNLMSDFEFRERYDDQTIDLLRFSILMQPPPDRRFFSVNETTGIIQTTQLIDREAICPSADECVIKFDVATKPIQFFQIIKASPT